MEHCSAVVFPDHNSQDKLAIVGIYRPPEKQHPPYQEAFDQMLRSNREHQITTAILGDLNTNAWRTTGEGENEEWLEKEQLWELSDPAQCTYRTGTVTDGVFLAVGKYVPEGALPLGIEEDTAGEFRQTYPVVVTEDRVLADHHMLYLDIHTIPEAKQPRTEKYKLDTLTKAEWEVMNEQMRGDERIRKLRTDILESNNVQRHYEKLMIIIRGCIKKQKTVGRMGERVQTTASFEKKQ